MIERTWQLTNNMDDYRVFNDDFNTFLDINAVDNGGNFALNVAVEELITNIIKFNPVNRVVDIVVALRITAQTLEISIKDNAGAFDINLAEKPDFSRNIAEIKIGGLGLELVKNLFDSCEYTYVQNNNFVKLVYNLPV